MTVEMHPPGAEGPVPDGVGTDPVGPPDLAVADDGPVTATAPGAEPTTPASPSAPFGWVPDDRPDPTQSSARGDEPGDPGWRRWYLPVGVKFALAVAAAAVWVGFSVWVSLPWQRELAEVVGPLLSWTCITLVAYLPGAVVAFMAASLAMDRQPPLHVTSPTTAVTVLVAAHNEQDSIGITLEYVARQDYAGPVTVIVAANNCTDDTVPRAVVAAAEYGIDLRVVHEPAPGKSHALNAALPYVDTPLVVTVDADTLLHREALRRLVSRLESSPRDTVAVAGAVLVRNSRTNLLTRMQEWDYYLGIVAVKRMQGMYQSTLVAQGAFSVYRTEEVRAVGGWPDAIGEDIVLTWRLMANRDRVFFEPTAVAFTDVPVHVRHFFRQRARWARGMFEGLSEIPPWSQPRVISKLIAGIDLLIPFLDIGYGVIFLGGLVLALFGVTILVSWWTLLVLPLTVLVYGLLRRWQLRRIFTPLGLRVRRNRMGYVAFLVVYQVLCSWASLVGYTQHLVRTDRRWK